MKDILHDIQARLRQRLGDIQFTPCTMGGTNFLFVLEGTDPLQIAKISGLNREDVANEYQCLKLLAPSGIAPRPYDLLEFGAQCVLMMEYRAGKNLLESILEWNQEDWRLALPYYVKMGEWLATHIHTHTYDDSQSIRPALLADLRPADLALPYVPGPLTHASYALLSQVPVNRQDWVLTHGDYGAHNVLLAPNETVTILDWEFAAWDQPVADLACVCFWTHLHFPETARERCAAFLQGYQAHHPISLSAGLLRTFSVAYIWKLLYRIADLPDSVKEEWNRRLAWTLEHHFL